MNGALAWLKAQGLAIPEGSEAVETGIVLPILLLLVLGTFEYSRFVMLRNLVDNAVREGARAAVVHTYDYTTAQVQSVVTGKLAGQDAQLSGLNIQVFKADPTTGASLDALRSGVLQLVAIFLLQEKPLLASRSES